MKKKISLFIVVSLLLSYLTFLSPVSQASPTLVSIEPDIGAPATSTNSRGSFNYFDWTSTGSYPVGTLFTVKIHTDSKPRMVIGTSDVQDWSYDSTTSVVTIHAKSVAIHKKDSSGNYQYYPSYIGVAVGTPARGEGPPLEEAQGTWVATNANSWVMLPSDSSIKAKEGDDGGRNRPGDGDRGEKPGEGGSGRPSRITIKVEGKTGVKNGFFKIFRPNALMKAEGLTIETIGAFIDGETVESTIQQIGNAEDTSESSGALITLRLGYSTHIITTGTAIGVSLKSSSAKIKKGKTVKLSGWISPRKSGYKVFLYKKKKGEKRFTKIKKFAKTVANGFYQLKQTLADKGTYYFKTKVVKTNKTSANQKVIVN